MGPSAAGQIGMVAMGLIGLAGVLRAWHLRRQARRTGAVAPDPARDDAALVERRMAAYLASRDAP